jgi:hypothetical protein
MGNALQMASTHTELRPTGTLLTHRGTLTPATPPPVWSSRAVNGTEGSA